MREFILWARKSPTSPNRFVEDLSQMGRITNISQFIVNALFYSNQIRDGVTIHIVLDGPTSPPKTVRIESDTFGSMTGFDDRSVCTLLQQALTVGYNLAMNEETSVMPGVAIAKKSFERLVKEKSEQIPLYVLHPRGNDIRTESIVLPAAFIFTDHLAMPKKTVRYLTHRLGAKRIAVGPQVLFSSQCLVLVHNELDRKK